jgi:hypothetical protein
MEDPLADYLLANDLRSDIEILVDVASDKLVFDIKKKIKKINLKDRQQLSAIASL